MALVRQCLYLLVYFGNYSSKVSLGEMSRSDWFVRVAFKDRWCSVFLLPD